MICRTLGGGGGGGGYNPGSKLRVCLSKTLLDVINFSPPPPSLRGSKFPRGKQNLEFSSENASKGQEITVILYVDEPSKR